jgi:hypothetical protein
LEISSDMATIWQPGSRIASTFSLPSMVGKIHQHSHIFLVAFSACHKPTRRKSHNVDNFF